MSDKQTFILAHRAARQSAMRAISYAPDGFVCEVKPRKRSSDQNALMWALLTEVSEQVEWHGRKLSPESWKCVFSAALKKQDVVPGLNGDFVVLGQSTSRMTVRELSELVELIQAFGAEQGVRFTAPAGQGYEDLARQYA
ncbi:recombination protein NinB [Robbsia andropogonis]|uniref:recombination protein NinB n=1 Tax=Robbsia andropogonis TaxID=28092 RepID=UPI0020A0C4B3|nr:recombination protein NinB [Robbsia andropogonis]MCP1121585.1 recombination protein NinB [Robbsia andropogonis]MCP1131407.1 recombination protein NinB [Robbsia andropogonis]